MTARPGVISSGHTISSVSHLASWVDNHGAEAYADSDFSRVLASLLGADDLLVTIQSAVRTQSCDWLSSKTIKGRGAYAKAQQLAMSLMLAGVQHGLQVARGTEKVPADPVFFLATRERPYAFGYLLARRREVRI